MSDLVIYIFKKRVKEAVMKYNLEDGQLRAATLRWFVPTHSHDFQSVSTTASNVCQVKPKFHYADFPVTSATSPRQACDISSTRHAAYDFLLRSYSNFARKVHGFRDIRLLKLP